MVITEEERNRGGDDTRPRNVRDVIKVCVGVKVLGWRGASHQAATIGGGTLLVSVCFTEGGKEEPGGA